MEGLKQFVAVSLLTFINLSRKSDDPLGIGMYVLVGTLALSTLFQIAAYFSLKITLDERSVESYYRLIWSNRLVVPLERIQEVHFTASLLYQVFGLVKVRVETGGGGKDLVMNGISKAYAETLRDQLLQRSVKPTTDGEPEKPLDQEILTVPFRNLVLKGALNNRAFFLVLGVLGLMAEFGLDVLKRYVTVLEVLATSANWLIGFVVFLALFAVGWGVSIVLTVNSYWNFRLLRTSKGLSVQHGLSSRQEKSVRINRVQQITFHQGMLERLAKIWSVAVVAAAVRLGDGDDSAAGAFMLTPASSRNEAFSLARLVFPRLDLEGLPWRKIRLVAFWPRIVPGVITVTIMMTILYLVLSPLKSLSFFNVVRANVWPVFAGVLGLQALLTFFLVRSTRFAFDGEHLANARFALKTVMSVSQVSRLQSITVSESPLQRRFKLRSINAAFPQSEINILDADQSDSARLCEELLAERHQHPGRGV